MSRFQYTVCCLFLVTSLTGYTQSQDKLFYQGTYFGNPNQVIVNTPIFVEIVIYQDSINGPVAYSEQHNTATNQNGLFTVILGEGTASSGNFDLIPWSGNKIFMQVKSEAQDGFQAPKYTYSKFNSVPYAFYVKYADSILSNPPVEQDTYFLSSASAAITENDKINWNKDTNATNEIQYFIISGDSLKISQGNSIKLIKNINQYDSLSNTPELPSNLSQLSNDLSLPDLNDHDKNPENEIQFLRLSHDTLFISKSNFLITTIPSGTYNSYTDLQNKPDIPNALSAPINDVGFLSSPNDDDFLSSNELQEISKSGDTITLSNGGAVLLNDDDSANELQNLSRENNLLSLSGSNSVNLPYDNTDNQYFTVSNYGDSLFLSDGNFVIIPTISWANANKFNPNLTYSGVTDIEGNHYKTIQIGNQEWMAEDLRVSKFSNGDAIPLMFDNAIWNVTNQGAWTYVNNDFNNNKLGKLYNGEVVIDTRNVCPNGWHIPTDIEWTSLSNYLGGVNLAGGKLKNSDLNFWNIPNEQASNETGFSALANGYRSVDGRFFNFKTSGYWWSKTTNFSYTAWIRFLNYNSGELLRSNVDKKTGCNVRCLRD